jgi:hypothetical protein
VDFAAFPRGRRDLAIARVWHEQAIDRRNPAPLRDILESPQSCTTRRCLSRHYDRGPTGGLDERLSRTCRRPAKATWTGINNLRIGRGRIRRGLVGGGCLEPTPAAHRHRGELMIGSPVAGVSAAVGARFLHIDLATTPRENLLALAFAAVLIFLMVGGTLWIMLGLNARMAM